MTKTKLTLSIDEKVLEEYKNYCEKEGLIISRQVEKFIEEQLKKKKM
jgi:antitoxin component of RelBE/YafQ-DinJ toxin-antitoxin module